MAQFRSAVLFACVVLWGANAAHAQSAPQTSPEARAMCMDIEKNINQLAPFTQTSCRVGGGSTKDVMSFLVVALTVVWDDPQSKQEWLESVVESVGATLNASPDAKVDEIIVADPSQLADRVAYALPAAVARNLQAKMKDGSLKKADVYPLIEKELIKKPITAR